MNLDAKECLKIKKIRSAKDKNDEPYNVYSYQGKGFTSRDDFEEARKEGGIYELTLTESEYERTAPDGTTETVKSWREDGFVLFSQMKGITRNQAELKAIAKEFDLSTAEVEF